MLIILPMKDKITSNAISPARSADANQKLGP